MAELTPIENYVLVASNKKWLASLLPSFSGKVVADAIRVSNVKVVTENKQSQLCIDIGMKNEFCASITNEGSDLLGKVTLPKKAKDKISSLSNKRVNSYSLFAQGIPDIIYVVKDKDQMPVEIYFKRPIIYARER
jgi:hypothetical protein